MYAERVSVHLSGLELLDYTQALEAYQEALALVRKLDDRSGQRLSFSNIGSVLEKHNQPELATVFYKEAVNITTPTGQQ